MICCQEVVWVVIWRIQQEILAEVRAQLEVLEKGEASRKSKRETNCGP